MRPFNFSKEGKVAAFLLAALGIALIGASDHAYSSATEEICLPWIACQPGDAGISLQNSANHPEPEDVRGRIAPSIVQEAAHLPKEILGEWELRSVSAEEKVVVNPEGTRSDFIKIPWRDAWSEVGGTAILDYNAIRSTYRLRLDDGFQYTFSLRPQSRDSYEVTDVQDLSALNRAFNFFNQKDAAFNNILKAASVFTNTMCVQSSAIYLIEKLLAGEFEHPSELQLFTLQK